VPECLRDAKAEIYRHDVSLHIARVWMMAGLDRLGAAAAGHLDPLWLAELQRRYVTSGVAAPPPGHIPGVYPPLPPNLPPDMLQRERERIGNCHTFAV